MPVLIAQEPAAPPRAGGEPNLFSSPLPLMFGGLLLFWLVVMLPADRRRRREAAQLLADLKPGKRVVTSGGIVGVVVSARDGDDELTLRSADSKLKVLRSTVTRVLADDAPGDAGK